VLDFGCGSGRTLRWWAQHPQRPLLHGTDIDRAALRWVRRHLPVETCRNDPLPPLQYADGSFDVIYSISVFTHLDERYQDAWLAELKRVLKRDGVALMTVRSELDNARLPLALQEQVRQRGIVFHVDGLSEQFFPEFYQSTYHSADYIERHWGGLFRILGKIPMGYVDLLVMTRP
jgi:cyclopropane fatty-acyl-phospholipid synthase-like methyltransferase